MPEAAGVAEAPIRQIAARELVHNAKGEVVDVFFVQDDKRISLKSLLPGDYIIIFTPWVEWDQGIPNRYHPQLKMVQVITGNPNARKGNDNLSLLHEAGHAVDFRENREENTRETSEVYLADSVYGAYCIIRRGETRETTLYNLQDAKNTILKSKLIGLLSDAELNVILARYDRESSELLGEYSIKNDKQIHKRLHKRVQELRYNFAHRGEKRAWSLALHAYRMLKKQGVHIYSGNLKDVMDRIDRSQIGYEKEYQDFPWEERLVKNITAREKYQLRKK